MRIVAGTRRGARIHTGRAERFRPTSDRVREALFAILGDRVEGARALDLCAGSGALGFEALAEVGDLPRRALESAPPTTPPRDLARLAETRLKLELAAKNYDTATKLFERVMQESAPRRGPFAVGFALETMAGGQPRPARPS